jgi:hypothetical protein
MAMAMAMGGGIHYEIDASEPSEDMSTRKIYLHEHAICLLYIPADPSPGQNVFDGGNQFMGRVTENKIRAWDLRRMKTHLQNRQAGK